MKLLPHWCITDKNPAFYDTDSATAIEQTAKLYAAMQTLISEYNEFVDGVNESITEFMDSSDKNYKTFTIEISQKFQDFIDVVEVKIKAQDMKIDNAIDYMTTNLYLGLEELFIEMRENGELDSAVQKSIVDLSNAIRALSSRMDEFTKLGEGDTTGDAELVDARTDHMGRVFENTGTHIRTIEIETEKALATRETVKYGRTSFYIIDELRDQNQKSFTSAGTTHNLANATKILKCPKYLGFKVKGNARLILYIGDLDESGNFVLDENYIIYTTSEGFINYFSKDHNRIIKTDGTKYFYYALVDGEEGAFEIVGADTIKESSIQADAYTPYWCNLAGKVFSGYNYYSLLIPNGCYYAILTDNAPTGYDRRNMLLSAVNKETLNTMEHIEVPSFGYVPEDSQGVVLRIPNDCKREEFELYIYPGEIYALSKTGVQKRMAEIAHDFVDTFNFQVKKSLFWYESTRPMEVGKRFFGVPYASRWQNSHFVGYEVTPETALNALNDEYSIAYDGGVTENGRVFSNNAERTEIHDNGGTGYGLVCSAFVSLLQGCPYPQSNRGFTYDENFELHKVNHTAGGMSLANRELDHCLFVDELFKDGYTIYHGVNPCCAKSVHTGDGKYNVLYQRTKESLVHEYPYSISSLNNSGYDVNFTSMENMEVPEGSIRPWRGHKSVYGPWDKSEHGTGIAITIHGAEICHLVKPDGTTHDIPVNGLRYLDVTDYVNQDGTYELYSDISDVKERFKYFSHTPVTFHFDGDGKAIFSSDDVMYCYVDVVGYGDRYNGTDAESEGSIVIANGGYYKTLAEHPERIKAVYAAIVSDPSEDKWGRYSVECSLK